MATHPLLALSTLSAPLLTNLPTGPLPTSLTTCLLAHTLPTTIQVGHRDSMVSSSNTLTIHLRHTRSAPWVDTSSHLIMATLSIVLMGRACLANFLPQQLQSLNLLEPQLLTHLRSPCDSLGLMEMLPMVPQGHLLLRMGTGTLLHLHHLLLPLTLFCKVAGQAPV